MKRIFLAITLAVLATVSHAQVTSWKVTNYEVTFEITNMGIPVDGTLQGLQYSVSFDPNQLSESKIMGSVDVNTIDTGIGARDRHLKNEDYFDVERFPRIHISSTNLRKGIDKPYEGSFKLTIRDQSQFLEVPFSFDQQGNQAVLNATFNIDRRDFEVGGYSLSMGDMVEISIRMELEK